MRKVPNLNNKTFRIFLIECHLKLPSSRYQVLGSRQRVASITTLLEIATCEEIYSKAKAVLSWIPGQMTSFGENGEVLQLNDL